MKSTEITDAAKEGGRRAVNLGTDTGSSGAVLGADKAVCGVVLPKDTDDSCAVLVTDVVHENAGSSCAVLVTDVVHENAGSSGAVLDTGADSRNADLNKTNHKEYKYSHIFKRLMTFALPIIFSKVMQNAGSFIDALVIGQSLGDAGLAAISAAAPVISLLTNLTVGFAVGISVAVAHRYGAKDTPGLQKVVHTSVALGIVLGAVLMLIGLLFSRQILLLVNVPPEILDLSAQYLSIYFFGGFFIVMYNILSNILLGVGDSQRPMYYLTASVALNILLNHVFITRLGWGLNGLAYAIIISKGVLFLLAFARLIAVKEGYRLTITKIRFNQKTLKIILLLSLPMAIQSSLFSFANAVFATNIFTYGADVVSAWGTTSRIDNIILAVVDSFGLAITTLVGRYWGSRNLKAMRMSVRCATVTTAALSALTALMLVFFGRELAGLFSKDMQIIEYSYLMLNRVGVFYILLTTANVLGGAVRGTGNSTVPMLINFVCVLGVRLGWIALVPLLFAPSMQLEAFLLCFVASYAALFVVMGIYYFFYMKKLYRKLPQIPLIT